MPALRKRKVDQFKVSTHPQASKIVDVLVKKGEVSREEGEKLKGIWRRCDTIARIFHVIERFYPTFHIDDGVLRAYFDVRPWSLNSGTNENKPIFFQQMSSEEFSSYKTEDPRNLGVHSLLSGNDPRDYCRSVMVNLDHVMTWWNNKTEEALSESGGWHCERDAHGVPRPIELQRSSEPGTYDWAAPYITGRKDIPHMVIRSYHACRQNTEILRSELQAILQLMWWKTKSHEGTEHKIIPVLLISIRAQMFRVYEAYLEGEKIVLRCSEPIYMRLTDDTKDQEKVFKEIARWARPTPVGNTRNPSATTLSQRPQGSPRQNPRASNPSTPNYGGKSPSTRTPGSSTSQHGGRTYDSRAPTHSRSQWTHSPDKRQASYPSTQQSNDRYLNTKSPGLSTSQHGSGAYHTRTPSPSKSQLVQTSDKHMASRPSTPQQSGEHCNSTSLYSSPSYSPRDSRETVAADLPRRHLAPKDTNLRISDQQMSQYTAKQRDVRFSEYATQPYAGKYHDTNTSTSSRSYRPDVNAPSAHPSQPPRKHNDMKNRTPPRLDRDYSDAWVSPNEPCTGKGQKVSPPKASRSKKLFWGMVGLQPEQVK